MARFEKAKHDVVDVNEEIEKLTSGKKKTTKEKSATKKDTKEKDKKKESKTTKGKDKKDKKEKKQKTHFFKEVHKEMSKVKWPSKKDMIKYSTATIIFIIFFGAFFFAIDFLVAMIKAWV